jgi:hypothetical protein
MDYLILFLLQLGIIYFLSRRLNQLVYQFFYKITRNNKISIYLYALLFAPGTFIHEISHLLIALVLFVPVGRISITPKILKKGVRLGSVTIAKTDPIRRFAVGFAPFIAGVITIIGSLYLVLSWNLITNWWAISLIVYINFEVSNTMFVSKKDLEGVGAFLLGFACFYFVLIYYGVDVVSYVKSIITTEVALLIREANIFISVPILIDFLLILILESFRRLTK